MILTCQLVFPLLSIPKPLYSNPDRIDNKENTSTNDSHVTKIEDYLKAHRQISKSGVSKSIAHVIKHTSFQLYRVHLDGVI